MSNIVEIHSLAMKYHSINGEVSAISDLNLSIEEGEFISIVGPSGCGKSTLLSLISGLIQPTSGKICIRGETVSKISGEVGYMLQKDHLFEWRTILENALLGLEIKKILTPENKNYAIGLLKTYGLYEFKDKFPEQLSVGMRQRAALIRTLAVKPAILLLDEAFSALDYQTRLLVMEDIYTIIKKENKTAVLVTHDIAESISMSDRVVVLSRRPASIKSIHEINLNCINRTPINSRESPNFSRYFNIIWKELDVHV